jgi:hypothetical protein
VTIVDNVISAPPVLCHRPKPYTKLVYSTEVKFSADKSRRELGLTYRPMAETLRDTAMSMVDSGWVKCKRRAVDETSSLKGATS